MTEFVRVDPSDNAAFDAWYDTVTRSDRFGREYAVPFTHDELQLDLQRDNPHHAQQIHALLDSGVVVGGLHLQMPLSDNTELLEFEVQVDPDHRRRGYGTRLIAELERIASAEQRTVLLTQLHQPMDSPPAPGVGFSVAIGFAEANRETHRTLDSPVPVELLDRLGDEAAARHGDYRIVSWTDRCPDELVDAMAVCESVFMGEVPLGDTAYEPEVWDAARVREAEARTADMRRHAYVSAAVAPDGSMAGFTQQVVPDLDPGKVMQWATLVLPAHRGHRLGAALKVANQRQMQAEHPEPLVVHTWNAEVNTHMNAVNAALGYRPVETLLEMQKRL